MRTGRRARSLRSTRRRTAPLATLFVVASLAGADDGAAKVAGPSRAPVEGCKWVRIADAKLELEAWVQRCDFGFRKIDFLFTPTGLAIRYSDGGAPEQVVDVFPLEAGETPEAGVKRVFAARTSPAVAARCTLAPFADGKPPPGVERFSFVPDRAYQKELAAKADPNEVPEPPCGSFGTAPDGVQYFEVQPGSAAAREVLFVRVGQDEPLFDERTLRILPPH